MTSKPEAPSSVRDFALAVIAPPVASGICSVQKRSLALLPVVQEPPGTDDGELLLAVVSRHRRPGGHCEGGGYRPDED